MILCISSICDNSYPDIFAEKGHILAMPHLAYSVEVGGVAGMVGITHQKGAEEDLEAERGVVAEEEVVEAGAVHGM